MTVFDLIGLVGVVFYILGFVGLQVWTWQPHSYRYLLCNLFGALLTLISLYYSFNLASCISQLIWFGISGFGLLQVKKQNQQTTLNQHPTDSLMHLSQVITSELDNTHMVSVNSPQLTTNDNQQLAP